MDMLAAARLGDEVAHGFGVAAMVAGAVAGALIGAAVVAATVATGGVALAIMAGSIAAGGLSMWVQLDRPGSSTLTSLCEARGLALVAGPKFSVDGSLERFLRLPFTSPVADLDAGVQLLAESWEQLSARATRSTVDERLPQVV